MTAFLDLPHTIPPICRLLVVPPRICLGRITHDATFLSPSAKPAMPCQSDHWTMLDIPAINSHFQAGGCIHLIYEISFAMEYTAGRTLHEVFSSMLRQYMTASHSGTAAAYKGCPRCEAPQALYTLPTCANATCCRGSSTPSVLTMIQDMAW